MKYVLFFLIFFLATINTDGQIANGSFENGSNPDLSDWSWTCGALSANTAPPGGGNWCMFVEGGNTQSCFPGYAYQKIPGVSNGQSYILSGWAYAQSNPPVGQHVGLYFGKINNGNISLQSGDTTFSTSWTQLIVQSSFNLGAGDTAAVILFGGLVGGPAQAFGFFDLISLQTVTSITEVQQNNILTLSPNPVSHQVSLYSQNYLNNASMKIIDVYGRTVEQKNNISGHSLVLSCNNFPNGIYIITLEDDSKNFLLRRMMVSH